MSQSNSALSERFREIVPMHHPERMPLKNEKGLAPEGREQALESNQFG